jgi:hypothetical protein
LQRYPIAFNAANHVFDADGLRLQAVLGSGHFDSYLRGNVVTTGNGLNAGAEGASLPTRLADIGLTLSNLAAIEIGTCITAGDSGIAVVVAKDAVAGTITFEAVTSGIRSAFKGNWHITFTAFAFARVAVDVVNSNTTTIQFKTPVASTDLSASARYQSGLRIAVQQLCGGIDVAPVRRQCDQPVPEGPLGENMGTVKPLTATAKRRGSGLAIGHF